MPRKRNHCRQRDVTRLLRAHKAADVPQPIIKVTRDGDLVAIPNNLPEADKPDANPWDQRIGDLAARTT